MAQPAYEKHIDGVIQGGYTVPNFIQNNWRAQEAINKGNQQVELYYHGSVATQKTYDNIAIDKGSLDQSAENAHAQAAQQRQRMVGLNQYIPSTDGKKVFMLGDQILRIDNERVTDELGNVKMKNTYNIKNNKKGLMASYDANLTDAFGNKSQIQWQGSYTSDSVHYAGKDTNANRNIAQYTMTETDSAGNKKFSSWKAQSYAGKVPTAISESVTVANAGENPYTLSFTRSNMKYESNNDNPSSYEEIGIGEDGLAYYLTRSNISYNGKNQMAGYHEEKKQTQVDGSISTFISTAEFKYKEIGAKFGKDVKDQDPDQLLESTINTQVKNADDSSKTEETNTKYHYENNKLTGATARTKFDGNEAWYEYKDKEGRNLTKNTDARGNATFSYEDANTKKIVEVDKSQVNEPTLKSKNKYSGEATKELDAINGELLEKNSGGRTIYYSGGEINENQIQRIENLTTDYENELRNNLPRQITSHEHLETTYPALDPNNEHKSVQNIDTNYIYKANGNLDSASGSGKASGWEYTSQRGWYGKYSIDDIKETYEIKVGKPFKNSTTKSKNYEEYQAPFESEEGENAVIRTQFSNQAASNGDKV